MIMVLTKELENKWCPSNKKHFESLGYTYTKMKDTFMVKFILEVQETSIQDGINILIN